MSRDPTLSPDVLLSQLLRAWVEDRAGMLSVKRGAGGPYLHADAAWSRFVGGEGALLLGRADAELFDAPIAAALRAADQTALEHAGPIWSEHRFEWRGQAHEFRVLRAADGERIGSLWLDAAGSRQREQQLRSALDQLEQQQRANAQLRREVADQVPRDPASGLYGRSHFEDQLRREADLSIREHREFALVLIEVDPLKDQALALGDAARARVQESVGSLLRSGTRAMDSSCRFDEGRFAVLLSGVGLATAHARMEGLRRRCATQIVLLEGHELGFSVAVGVASFPHTAQSLPDLMQACESALSEARRRGGNHVTLASITLS